ncbi:hypothetical protein SSBR45G_61460 [Bradyrhizobium sp. SSBR45G]|uniref:hypothetical protein n=1 Tax=unclassified Bradyrhizobium TaxID=2631580 RepID=UPI002342BA62|nr:MULTISPECIES: hypothetical protein [unclassified Bradyrhizobium]GLH81237.1 hypothetical protein SSBR45G_61460 [Bradyrhizobium sp. SSBR45G]GLH88743.1 hypothetical protein SSBR45R_62040 [Bradyrhizobium sp. SSBR45R]
MKLLVGAVSASLIATFAAQAEPLPPSGLRAPYSAVSDFDQPYPEPPPAVVPAPPPRYGYGPGPDYGYRDQRYAPPAPVYRQDGYRDGYQQDFGYAPAFLPVHEVYAILRDNGFSPLGAPRQRGNVYIVAVLDRQGEDGKLVVDARSGRILRFVPAFQWGEDYERMRFEPRGGLERLPAPTVIRADPRVVPAMPPAPRVATAMPAQPKVPTPAARPVAPPPQTAALNPKPAEAVKPAPKPDIKPAEARPAEMKPVETKPVEAKADAPKAGEAKAADPKAADPKAADPKAADAKSSDAKLSEIKPADAKASEVKPSDAKPVQSAAAAPQTTGSIAPAARPAPQILPTAKMPPAQGLD